MSNLPSNRNEPMLALIERMARDPAVDVGKLQALLTMQREVEADQAKREYAEAFARLQPQLPRVKRDGSIHIPAKPGKAASHSHYAKLETIDAAIRPLLAAEGFGISFDSEPRQGEGGGLIVTARLRHHGGYSETASIPVPLDTSGSKNNIQGYGSALSYGRRYALCALLNIITEGEDDDGVRGGARFITVEEAAGLDTALRAAGADRDRYLRFLGVADLTSITVEQLTVAQNAIRLTAERRRKTTPGASQ